MNLARHLSVLWRFRAVVAVGIFLGIALAVLAAVKVPAMERRGTETWAVKSDIFVTQPGFPWGRVTLPAQQQSAVVPDSSVTATKPDKSQQFADPSRFSNLALLYSVIAYSDQVRKKLPGHPSVSQIQATPIDATGNGTVFLPIIRITTQGLSPEAAKNLNTATVAGLRSLLEGEQKAANIPDNERIRLNILNNPGAPELIQGRSLTPSILALLLCVLGAIALAHVLEALKPRPEWQVADEHLHMGLRPAPVAAVTHAPVVGPSVVPPPPTSSHWASNGSARSAAGNGAEDQGEVAGQESEPSRRRGRLFR